MSGFSLVDWARQASTIRPAQPRPVITLEEVRLHRTEHSCWMVIRGICYDVTPYLRYHPAGVNEIMRGAGEDATNLFQEYHSWVNVANMLKSCQIGPVSAKEEAWAVCSVMNLGKVSADVYHLSLSGLDPPPSSRNKKLWHVKLRVLHEPTKRVLERPYTPLPLSEDGKVHLYVKEYSARRQTSWLLTHSPSPLIVSARINPSDDVTWDGVSKIGMVCNGTGVLPMMQIMAQASAEMWLVWINRKREHVFGLEILARIPNLRVLHVFAQEHGENGMAGEVYARLDEQLLQDHPEALPPIEDALAGLAKIFICGSWDFMSSARASLFLRGFPSAALERI